MGLAKIQLLPFPHPYLAFPCGCHEHLLPHVLVALDYMLILLIDWFLFCQQFSVIHGPHAHQCLHALHVDPHQTLYHPPIAQPLMQLGFILSLA